jgi:hypothetical protein
MIFWISVAVFLMLGSYLLLKGLVEILHLLFIAMTDYDSDDH